MISLTTAEALFSIMGLLITAGLYLINKSIRRAQKETEITVKLEAMTKKNEEQDDHMEFQDNRYESLDGKVDKVLEEIGKLQITKEQVAQLKRENDERQRENNILMQKVDKMFSMMSRMEQNITALKR